LFIDLFSFDIDTQLTHPLSFTLLNIFLYQRAQLKVLINLPNIQTILERYLTRLVLG